MRKWLLLGLMCLLFLLPVSAVADDLALTPDGEGYNFSFRMPGQQFALLEYSTANQSGRLVLYGPDGTFSGRIDLSLSAGCKKLRVTTKTLTDVIDDDTSVSLSLPAAPAPEGRSSGKVQNLVLTETPDGFSYSFTAEGADYMVMACRSKEESQKMYIYPLDAAGTFAGQVTMPLTYARTLMTVQLLNSQGIVLKEGQVRKGYVPPAWPEGQPGRLSGVTVCIDPGHQENGDPVVEPVGPGLQGKTAGTSGMAQGCVTQRKESIVTLEIAYVLRDELLRQGAKVVMTRTQQMEFHTNIQRCAIAKVGGADIMLRLHCDTRESRTKRGISIFSPLNSTFARAVADPAEYRKMGELLINAMKRAVGYELTDKTGFVTLNDAYVGNNWAEMPCFLVEMGYLSNPQDDFQLSHPAYQQILAEGMAQGVYEIAVERDLIEAQ